MTKIILFLLLVLGLNLPLMARTQCFLALEDNKILKQEGDCTTRHPPCSTFKIFISLMGYDAGLLVNETQPELPFKEGYPSYLPIWRQPHNPKLWMKNTCLWYSQFITKSLRVEKFKDYLAKLNYGNQDISGDAGQDNTLTSS